MWPGSRRLVASGIPYAGDQARVVGPLVPSRARARFRRWLRRHRDVFLVVCIMDVYVLVLKLEMCSISLCLVDPGDKMRMVGSRVLVGGDVGGCKIVI